MTTAVQIRKNPDFYCVVIYGKYEKIKVGRVGEIQVFDDGKIVVYLVRNGRKSKIFLFRTNSKDGSHKIGGCYPNVDLLIDTKTQGKSSRLRNVLTYLTQHKIVLDSLSDIFFMRLNTILEGKDFRVKHLKRFLVNEEV